MELRKVFQKCLLKKRTKELFFKFMSIKAIIRFICAILSFFFSICIKDMAY